MYYEDLTLPVLCISESFIEIKIKLIFYFPTSCAATKKCENKNLA